MANWIKVMAQMVKEADMERNESLNLSIDPETIYGPMVIDANKISSYSAIYLEDGEASDSLSEILLDSGQWLIISAPFNVLDRLIRKAE